MTTITIHELKIDTIIGVYAWERAIKQPVLFDIEFTIDNTIAATSDNIKDAYDYAAIAERVNQFVSNSNYQLIETLAERVAELLMTEFKISGLKLRLSKPTAIKNAKAVSITLNYV